MFSFFPHSKRREKKEFELCQLRSLHYRAVTANVHEKDLYGQTNLKIWISDNLCLRTKHGLGLICCDGMISENVACHHFAARRTIKKRLHWLLHIFRGTALAQCFKVLCYKFGRSLVRSQMMSLEFFIDIKSFRSHYGPGVDSASNRNGY